MEQIKNYLKDQWNSSWKFPINTLTVGVLLFSIVLNLGGRKLASVLTLPFWLDTVGTLLSAVLYGPLAGMIVAIFSNALVGLQDVVSFYYIIVAVSIGFVVGVFYPQGKKIDMFSGIATSVGAGVIAVLISTPLNLYFYDGYTGNIWGDGLYNMLSMDIHVKWVCAVLGEAFVDVPDKALSVTIALLLVMAARKLKPREERRLMMLIVGASALLIPFHDVRA
ncbi:MAG: hypothetical protein K6A69_08460, partial [Lachnospiraceae bacterium]|nr:hypothetical protein [Lachnospiraceae bacterium]